MKLSSVWAMEVTPSTLTLTSSDEDRGRRSHGTRTQNKTIRKPIVPRHIEREKKNFNRINKPQLEFNFSFIVLTFYFL